MNQWIPRIALLILLLSTMAGFAPGGSFPGAPMTLAQGDCDVWTSLHNSESSFDEVTAPYANDDFEIVYSSTIDAQTVDSKDAAKSLTQLNLLPGRAAAIYSDQSTIIRIDSGSVMLTVCDQSLLHVVRDGSQTEEPLEAGQHQIDTGDTLFIGPDDIYYLEATVEAGTPEVTPSQSVGVQQLSAGLPTEQTAPESSAPGGASMTVASGPHPRACGRIYCVGP